MLVSISPIRVGEPPHRARRAGAQDFDVRLAAHQQRAAIDLGAETLFHRHRFAGEHRFVDHRALARAQRAVGGHAVARFDPHEVARHEFVARKPRKPPVAQYPDLRRRHGFQARERGFRLALLIDAERGVQHQDQRDRERLDRHVRRALGEPDAEIDEQRKEEDVDERAPELRERTPPDRRRRPLGQRVAAEPRKARARLGRGEAAGHRWKSLRFASALGASIAERAAAQAVLSP
ncbi:MAG: hypothetical protein RML56_05645 [Burkholderiales bacterium]|nr:hypothetical protein [Burkholderiales bacterium]